MYGVRVVVELWLLRGTFGGLSLCVFEWCLPGFRVWVA